MRKIKSVKLKNDYRTGYSYMEAGAPLVWETDENKWLLKGIGKWDEQEIINNKTDLFEIEYEEERKYIDVRIEANFSNFDIHYLRTVLYDYCHEAEFEVTELSEHWTDADLIDYNNFCDDNGYSREAWSIEKFKAERKSK